MEIINTLQQAALGPTCGHHGFDGPILEETWPTGSYFYCLNHRYFECNHFEAGLPPDKWFVTLRDGSPDSLGSNLKEEHAFSKSD